MKDPESSGRILRHGDQADEITREAIERRAVELAVIDGRTAEQVTEEDRRRGRLELQGAHLPDATTDDAPASGGLSRDPAEPRSLAGSRAPLRSGPDEQEAPERLALEGVEEAQHDQMLAARRRSPDTPPPSRP